MGQNHSPSPVWIQGSHFFNLFFFFLLDKITPARLFSHDATTLANTSLVLRLKIDHCVCTMKKKIIIVFPLDFCSWMIGFACWNSWAIWVKCFCVPSRNYWASGMAELRLHPLLSGSMTKVSLWSFLSWSMCKKKCLWDNFPFINCGPQELFGSTGIEAAAAGQDPSAPLQVSAAWLAPFQLATTALLHSQKRQNPISWAQ